MRVLTMNVFGHHREWGDRRSVLIPGLRALAPDVVTFQEAIVTPGYDQVDEILGAGFHVFHQAGRSKEGVGASIASRWPLDVVAELDLDDGAGGEGSWIGSLALVEIAVPGRIGPLLLAHHKPTWQSGLEHVRERQTVASAREIERALDGSDRHVVVAGDLDATPDAASIRFWTGRQSLDGMSVYYQDAWEALHQGEPGHTFTARNGLVSSAWKPRPGRRIDYILVRCGTHGSSLDITACEFAFSEPVAGIWASDHFGVVADLAFRDSSGDPP